MAKKTIKLNENELRSLIAECVKKAINEEGGYDMTTPEGRRGAENWMKYIMSQEDPAEEVAKQWVSENAPDYPDISWDSCCEFMKKAFIAGFEYGRNC